MKNIIMALIIVMMMAGLAMAQEATDTQSQASLVAMQEQEQVASAAPASETATPAAEDDSFTIATVNGEISGITKKGISIIYDKDYDNETEYEMMVFVNDKTQFKHKKDMSELKVGDLISIEYEKPGEKSKHKATATTISFVQSGVVSLASEDKQRSASGIDVTPQ